MWTVEFFGYMGWPDDDDDDHHHHRLEAEYWRGTASCCGVWFADEKGPMTFWSSDCLRESFLLVRYCVNMERMKGPRFSLSLMHTKKMRRYAKIIPNSTPRSAHLPRLVWMPYICCTTYHPGMGGPRASPLRMKLSNVRPMNSFKYMPCKHFRSVDKRRLKNGNLIYLTKLFNCRMLGQSRIIVGWWSTARLKFYKSNCRM